MGECEKILDFQSIDELSSVVMAAHELKAPLSLIRQLSFALDDNDLELDERTRIINQINLTSERAIRLTNDLTKTARLQDAMFTLEPINPHRLCEDVIDEIRPLFLAHNRDIILKANRLLKQSLLIANRDLLRRVIVNFSDNALNYTDKESTVEISLGLIKSGEKIRLSVRDHGPSVAINTVDNLKHIDYSQSPITSRPQSSGLGIYISNQFAQVMNGQIGLTRHHDGMSFFIDLQSSRQLSLL